VHKTGPKGEGDNSQIDQHEGKVGIYRGKKARDVAARLNPRSWLNGKKKTVKP
jgi:hypothetical protein